MIADEARYTFLRISRDLHRYVHEVISPICQTQGLTMQQMYVLKELQLSPGQSIGTLSDRVGILHTNFPSVCRKLEEGGLIERRRSETDRRSSILFLTPFGKEITDRMEKEISAALDEHMGVEVKMALNKINEGLESLEAVLKKQRGAHIVR